MRRVLTSAVIVALVAMGGVLVHPESAAAQDSVQSYQIPAGDLDAALRQYASVSRIQLIYSAELVRGKKSKGLSGDLVPADALQRLLAGSGLQAEVINDRTFALRPEPQEATTPRQAPPQSRVGSSSDRDVVGLPAIMVKGAKTLNVDIARTADDPQPYVIFDRAVIERSGAANLDDFLRTRLPMNASIRSPLQASESGGNASSVNLRGLGENQTLILIDGRRATRSLTSWNSAPGQADINGIPLEAVERIEVLPTSASAIYGGSATGGVINIVLRRDYVGTQASINYDNSFDTDSAVTRIDLSSGFSLFGGRTSVLLNGSYSEGNILLAKDRDFVQRGRERILSNNPGLIQSSSTPVLGGAVNIRSTNGSNLVLKDGTPLGASFTSAPVGYAGVASDGGLGLLGNSGRYNLDLSSSANSNIGGGNAPLTAAPRIKYFSGSVSHEFSDKLRLFMEASRSENESHVTQASVLVMNLPGNAPANPFQQGITVVTPTRQLNGVLRSNSKSDRFGSGLVFQLWEDWMGSLDYTWTRSQRSRLTEIPVNFYGSAVNDGIIDILGDIDAYGVDLRPYRVSDHSVSVPSFQVTTANPALRIGGPIGSLKAGSPRLSLLVERQETEFSGGSQHQHNGTAGTTSFFYAPDPSQKIDSAYLELQVPLVSSVNEIRWMESLELQLAGRWDRSASVNAAPTSYVQPGFSEPDPDFRPSFTYARTEVEKFSPLIAVRFQPNAHIALRASYSKGFLPPDVNQATPTSIVENVNATFVDPLRGNTGPVGPITAFNNGNPNLDAEISTTRSVGLIFTPTWLEGLRLSLDYSNIEKDGNIIALTRQQIMDNESYLPGRVTRGPRLDSDPAGWAGPVIAMDATLINSARTDLTTYDMQLDYAHHTAGYGSFSVFGMGTWTTRYDVQLVASSPMQDYLGWISGAAASLNFRGNAGVVWELEPWTVGWTTRYYSGYYVADPALTTSVGPFLAQGNGGRVPSQIYHDVFAQYRFGSRGWARSNRASDKVLDGLEIQLGIRNILNTAPPYDYSDSRFYYSGLGDPRLATYYITIRQKF